MSPDDAVTVWNAFKQEQPKLALALSVLPVSGQVSAAVEYYDAMKKGDSLDAIEAAVQFGLGAVGAKVGKLLMSAGEDAYKAARAALIEGRYATAASGDLGKASAAYTADKAATVNKIRAGVGTIAGAETLSTAMNVTQDKAFNMGFSAP